MSIWNSTQCMQYYADMEALEFRLVQYITFHDDQN